MPNDGKKPVITERSDYFEKGSPSGFTTPELLSNKFLELFAPQILLNNYLQAEAIHKMVQANPRVKQLLASKDIKLSVNPENVAELRDNHLQSIVEASLGMASEMGLDKTDKEIISRGALLHDFGKVLIPKHVINKKCQLTPNERQIINLHSQLGYELLGPTGLDERSLVIVRDHHKPFYRQEDLRSQIVTVADIYSALTSKRAYKDELTPEQSLRILEKYAQDGKINPAVLDSLKNYVTQNQAMELISA